MIAHEEHQFSWLLSSHRRPQTHGPIDPTAGEGAAATSDQHHGAALSICERSVQLLIVQHAFVMPRFAKLDAFFFLIKKGKFLKKS